MRKSFYWLAMLMLGLSCALWTACSDDDGKDDDNDDGGKKEQVNIVKKLTIDNFDNEERNEITISRQNELVSGITWKLSSLGADSEWEPYTVNYKVTSSKENVTVTFENDEMGRNTITYILNDKGFVTSAEQVMEEYPERAITWTFTNNVQNGMLEKLSMTVPGQGTDVVFQVVNNAEGNWVSVLGNSCILSSTKNTTSVNLNLMGIGLVDIENPVLSVAVLCGLVPVNPLLIESVSGVEESEDEEPVNVTFKFDTQKTADKISSLKVKMIQGDNPGMDFISVSLGY